MRYFESYYKNSVISNIYVDRIDLLLELMSFDDHKIHNVMVFDNNMWVSGDNLDGIFIDSLIDISPYSNPGDDYKNIRWHVHTFTVNKNKYMISHKGGDSFFVDADKIVREFRCENLESLLKSIHSFKLHSKTNN